MAGEAISTVVELADLTRVSCGILAHFEEWVHVEQVEVDWVLVLGHELLVAETWLVYQGGLLLQVSGAHVLMERQVHVVVHQLGLLL